MNPVYLLAAYSIATLALAAVGAGLVFSAWRRRDLRAAPASAAFSAIVAGYLLARGLSLFGPAAWTDFWLRVEWLFIALSRVGLYSLVLAYTGSGRWLTPRRLAALLVIPALTQVFVWWPGAPWLLTPVGRLMPVGPFLLSVDRPAGWWLAVYLSYSASLMALVLFAIGTVFLRAAGVHRRQAAVLLGSLIILALAGVADVTGLWAWPGLPLSPWALLVVAAVFAAASLRQLTVGVISVSVQRAIEFTPDAVFVVDPEQRILFVNAAAEAEFGLSAATASNQPLSEYLPLWPAVQPKLDPAQPVRAEVAWRGDHGLRVYDVQVTPLREMGGDLSGYLALLRDITASRQTEQRLRLQYAIARILTETPAQAVPGLLRLVCEHLEWEVGEYWEADAQRGGLRWAAGWQIPDLPAAAFTASARLLVLWPGEEMVGQVWASQEPRWCVNVLDEPAFMRADLAAQLGLCSALAFPIVMGAHSPGVLVFFSRAARPPDEALLELLAAIGRQVGQFLERARAEADARARARYMALLNDLTRGAIEQSDLGALVQVLADRLGELFDADGSYLLFWDEARQRPIPMAASGPLRDTYRRSARPQADEPTVTASVLALGRPLVIEDVFNTPYLSPRIAAQFPTRSMLGLPLIADGQKLGAALISYEHPHTFTPEEVERGELAAHQVALAVAKAQLLEAERQQRQLLETLRDASAVLNANLDVAAVLGELLSLIARVVPYDAGTVLAVDGDLVRVRQARGYEQFGPEAEARIRQTTMTLAGVPNLRRLMETGRPLIVADTAADSDWVRVDASSDLRSWIGVPILLGDRPAACLSLSKAEPGFYNDAHSRRLAAFADQAALALRNAHLYELAVRAAERRDVLHEASRAIGAAGFDLEALYAAIHQATARLMPADAFNITLVDEAAQEWVEVYLMDKGRRFPGERYPLSAYFPGYVLAQRRSILVDDFAAFPETEYKFAVYGEGDDTQSGLAVPMQAGEKIIGVLFTQSCRVRAYTADDQKLLELLAAQAAVAIENARLFALTRQLATEDPLTGLFNRRHLFILAEREIERARRYQHPLAAILLDLDHFKLINDSYGHATGDVVLKAIARVCLECLRATDAIGRYGGEEFLIVLPETAVTSAAQIAERIRQQVAATVVDTEQGRLAITTSLGVSALSPASLEAATSGINSLIDMADQALYSAKQNGRNQVVVYGSE